MKKLKYLLFFTILFVFIAIGYIINIYSEYENKQNEVRAFQKLAFEGFSLKAKGQNKQALASYEKAFEVYDEEHTSLADAADLYRKEGYIKKAKELYAKAYKSMNTKYIYLQNQALCEYLLKEYKKSIKNLKQLIHIDKNGLNYYKFLALNYFALGDKEKAFGYYTVLQNQEKYEKDTLLKEIKNEYEKLENKPTSLKVVYKYENTQDVPKLLSLMSDYKKEGFDIKALRTAQKILSINPNNDLANKMASNLYFKHAQIAQAYKYTSKIQNHDAQSLKTLASYYQQKQEYKMALENFEKSYAKQPNKDVLKYMVINALKAKKIKEMNDYLERLNNLDPVLSNKLIYALETDSSIKHTFLDKVTYLSKIEFFKLICKVRGCNES